MRVPLIAVGLAAAAIPTSAEALDRGDWDTAGRIGEVALVATAIGVPVASGDETGALQAIGSIGTAAILTEGLKRTVRARRPDGSDRRSFPSGHTSISFAAAATLHQRRGWAIGLPATLVATFVGISRVQAKEHHWRDVIAGAVIGEAAGFLITSPRDAKVKVFPWGDTKSAGVIVAMRF